MSLLKTLRRAALPIFAAGLTFSQPIAHAADPVVSGKAVITEPDSQGWQSLFDGTTLSGWMTFDAGGWSIAPDGILVGKGPRSHLFSPSTYRNLEFKAEIKLNNKGNSGMYFRAELMPGWPKGYEAQVENTSPDPQKTGSLYNFKRITEQLIQDDTWWTQHIIAVGNRVIIKVNGKIVVDYIDEKRSFTTGHVALQQHDPGSVVNYKNVKVKALPADEQAAWAIVRKESPEIK